MLNEFFNGSSGDGYTIERSVRLDSGDSSYLTKTFASAGNRRTWTWSGWMKRTGTWGYFLGAGNATNDRMDFRFNTDGQIALFSRNGTSTSRADLRTEASFRDFGAWYHVVIAFDASNDIVEDRIKIYANGVNQPLIVTKAVANVDHHINNTLGDYLGTRMDQAVFLDANLADVHFIDGQALDATDFGELDDNNVWQPKEYEGTYGANGYHLDFLDNSSDAALGTDISGNDNDWTPFNLTANAPDEITSITFSHSANYTSAFSMIFYAIRVNGTPVVLSSAEAEAQTELGATASVQECCVGNMFDGSLNNRFVVGPPSSYTATKTFTWTPATPLSMTDKIEVYTQTSNGSGAMAVAINDLPPRDFTPFGDIGWYDIGQNQYFSEIDSMIDSPTDYEASSGNNGGNYCTWNPLYSSYATTSLSSGNLDSSLQFTNGATLPYVVGTFAVSSGQWYWEVSLTGKSNDTEYIGFMASGSKTGEAWAFEDIGAYFSDGRLAVGTTPSSYGTAYTTGDVIGVALDADSDNLTFYKNGVSQGTVYVGTNLASYRPFISTNGTTVAQLASTNFGQRPFLYPLSGYKSLCTTNLPDPVIANGSTAMDVALYTGTNNTQSVTGLDFNPDLVWLKARSEVRSNHLFDAVRGATKFLKSDGTDNETTDADTLTSFNADGFSLGSSSKTNNNTQTYVGWTWDAGDSTVLNTDGTADALVRANPSTGFSIIKVSGVTPGNDGTVGHGLNAVPDMILEKAISTDSAWNVRHSGLPSWTSLMYLNYPSAYQELAGSWNVTDPTAQTLSFDWDYTLGASTTDAIFFVWTAIEGYSAFGSYEGNGSADGTFVYTGMRPAWLMIKKINAPDGWMIYDNQRSPFNPAISRLQADEGYGEYTGNVVGLDFLSNGFKIRTSDDDTNASGSTYIYACFASHPFKSARAK